MKKFIIILFLVCFGFSYGIKAQDEGAGENAVSKGKTSHILRWIGFFMTYSGYEPSESFNLQALLGNLGGEVFKGASFNYEMTMMLEQFQQDHFLTIYPVPVYNIDNNTFNRFNQLSLQFAEPRNTPYANLYIYLDTLSGGQFKISFTLNHYKKEEDYSAISQVMNSELQGKTFNKTGESVGPVNNAIAKGLELLGQQVGERYFPNLAVMHRGKLYSANQSLELWEGEMPVILKAVDQNRNSIYAGWAGPNVESMGDSAIFLTDIPGPYNLGVYRTYDAPDPDDYNKTIRKTDSIVLHVMVKPGTGIPDIRDILRTIVMEVLREKQESTTKTLIALREDSAELINEQDQQQGVIQALNPVFDEELKLQFIRIDNSLESRNLSQKEVEWIKEDPERAKMLDIFIKAYKVAFRINQQILLQEFLTAAINDKEKFRELLDNLVENSGRLLAGFVVNNLSKDQKAEMKAIVIDYINKNIILTINETNNNNPDQPVTDQ